MRRNPRCWTQLSRGLLNRDVMLAKAELRKHLDAVRMIPTESDEAWHYVAEGAWNLLGADSDVDRMRQPSGWRIRMVAGVGFEPTTSGPGPMKRAE